MDTSSTTTTVEEGLGKQETSETEPTTSDSDLMEFHSTSGAMEDKVSETIEVEKMAEQLDLVKIRSMTGAQRKRYLKEQRLKEGKEWLPKSEWMKKMGISPRTAPKGPKQKNRQRRKEEDSQTPSTSTGSKRMRDERTPDTPSHERQHVTKRPRQEIGKQTYSTVASVFRMAVFQQGYPLVNLTPQQEEQIQMALFEKIGEDASRSPKFRRVYLERGVLIFVCDGEETITWLKDMVPRITPWEEAKLLVKTAAELFRTGKVSMWVPKLLKNVEPATLFEKIRVQNRKISTESWKIINRKVEENGQTVVVEVDEQSLKVLREHDLRLYLGFSQVTFKVLKDIRRDDGGKLGPEGAADKPAAQ